MSKNAPPFPLMIARDLIKISLQKIMRPLLSLEKPQRRFALFHEVLPREEGVFNALLSFLDQSPLLDVTITFDDGFFSSASVIKKLQERKALFFVCPEFINRAGDSAAWQQFFHVNLSRKEDLRDTVLYNAVRPASWGDLKELVRLGHTIGSHTMTHARLSRLHSQKELEREIIGSAEAIEDALQVPVDSIAYPFGDARSMNERAYRIISKRYRYCFTGIRGNNQNVLCASVRWRDTVHLHWPLDYSIFLLKGGFDWRYSMGRRRFCAMTL